MQMPDPVTLNKILTKLYGDKFFEWEPETLESELAKLNHPVLSAYGQQELVTNIINAIRVIRSPASWALQEWHILEKTIAALTGKRVLFLEAQPPSSILEVFLGIELIKNIAPNPEFSEETLLYIGLVLFDMGVFYFPVEPYRSAIKLAIRYLPGSDSPECQACIEDFKDKITTLAKDQDKLFKILQICEKEPDIDIIQAAAGDDINARNALIALLCYLTVIAEIEAYDNSADNIADNSVVEPEAQLDEKAQPPKHIDEAFAAETIRIVEGTNERQVLEKIAIYHQRKKLPRSGTYLIQSDPDEFETDHTQGTYSGVSTGPGASVSSHQSSGKSFTKKAPKTMKVVDQDKNIEEGFSEKNLSDEITKLFSGLDI